MCVPDVISAMRKRAEDGGEDLEEGEELGGLWPIFDATSHVVRNLLLLIKKELDYVMMMSVFTLFIRSSVLHSCYTC